MLINVYTSLPPSASHSEADDYSQPLWFTIPIVTTQYLGINFKLFFFLNKSNLDPLRSKESTVGKYSKIINHRDKIKLGGGASSSEYIYLWESRLRRFSI